MRVQNGRQVSGKYLRDVLFHPPVFAACKGYPHIDDGGGQAGQFGFKAKFFLPFPAATELPQKSEEDRRVEFPGAMGIIGIGEGKTTRCGNPQVFQFPFTPLQAIGNLPEGMCAAQPTRIDLFPFWANEG